MVTPSKPMMLDHTLASPGCRAHWIINRLQAAKAGKRQSATATRNRFFQKPLHASRQDMSVNWQMAKSLGHQESEATRMNRWMCQCSPDDVVRHDRVHLLGAHQRHEVLVVHRRQLRHDVALRSAYGSTAPRPGLLHSSAGCGEIGVCSQNALCTQQPTR